MKKLIPIAVIAVFGTLTMLSCKKSDSDPTGTYTCTCIMTQNGTTDTVASSIPNQKKSVATSACNQATTTYTNLGATNVSCTLK